MKKERVLNMPEDETTKIEVERRISRLEGQTMVILAITSLNFAGTVALVLSII